MTPNDSAPADDAGPLGLSRANNRSSRVPRPRTTYDRQSMLGEGESVWVPDTSGDGRLPAIFLEAGSPGEGIEVDGRRQDIAWVLLKGGARAETAHMVVAAEMEPRVDMHERHRGSVLGSDKRLEMPEVLDLAGEEDLASTLRGALESDDLPTALGRDLLPLVEALELLVVRTDLSLDGLYTRDLATALRLEGGAAARRGVQLEWGENFAGHPSATDGRGTDWRIDPPGFNGNRWDVAIGLFRADWSAGSEASAKALAEEIAVRPTFPLPPSAESEDQP